jgi:DNA-binding GntR family transcriptional regulator
MNDAHRPQDGARAARAATSIQVPPGRGCWWIPLDRQNEESTTAVAQTYLELRRQILSGQLQPGEPLSEYQLAKTFNVSRTPVREALARLNSAGLVRSVPQRGMFVSELGPSDVVEIMEIRERLESLVVRRVMDQELSDEQLITWEGETEQARQLIADGQLPEALAIGSSLHDQLIEVAGNERLAAILAQLSEQVWLLSMVGIRAPGRPEVANEEHRVLLAHMRDGDADAAEAAMREHLRNEGRVLLSATLPKGVVAL